MVRAVLDGKIPLWPVIAGALALTASAAVVQAKVAEHDRQLSDLKDVVPAIRALQTEVSGLRTDVRDLRTVQLHREP